MGLFSFVKDAGKKLFGKDDAPESTQEALNAELKDLGLDASDVQVTVEGDKVMIKGKAPTQEQREKIILAAGNVDGVAAVEEEIEVADAAAEPVFYTVKKGDTLSAIAQATMGKASKYHAIFEANKPMLSDPDKIYPGQNLRIPQE
ncbi:peptidoglycan-binding protein LysM [Loktanella sp. TSTF-M6]|uniref:Peptidoglycan-binding protein LysM n=1 Tax=Loktanella gaetbuli TaxID=2881335 RepID=A0ABS8BUY1_9RHOB|nr:peptidoglycan-binding protein LysM [Loktanella gaetbuli]MCB5199515.1 peptidoglycan-binding protein LysM [Loktanella gaetbuli]